MYASLVYTKFDTIIFHASLVYADFSVRKNL